MYHLLPVHVHVSYVLHKSKKILYNMGIESRVWLLKKIFVTPPAMFLMYHLLPVSVSYVTWHCIICTCQISKILSIWVYNIIHEVCQMIQAVVSWRVPVEKPVENSQYPVIYGIVSYVLDVLIDCSHRQQ